jgi:hypothetical protein
MEIKESSLIKVQTLKKKFLDQIDTHNLAFEAPEVAEIIGWYLAGQDKIMMYLFRDSEGKLWKRLSGDNKDYGQQIFID